MILVFWHYFFLNQTKIILSKKKSQVQTALPFLCLFPLHLWIFHSFLILYVHIMSSHSFLFLAVVILPLCLYKQHLFCFHFALNFLFVFTAFLWQKASCSLPCFPLTSFPLFKFLIPLLSMWLSLCIFPSISSECMYAYRADHSILYHTF